MTEPYNLTRFTADITEIVQHEKDATTIVDAIEPLMAKII